LPTNRERGTGHHYGRERIEEEASQELPHVHRSHAKCCPLWLATARGLADPLDAGWLIGAKSLADSCAVGDPTACSSEFETWLRRTGSLERWDPLDDLLENTQVPGSLSKPLSGFLDGGLELVDPGVLLSTLRDQSPAWMFGSQCVHVELLHPVGCIGMELGQHG
jgi:hypothetical protein